MTNVINSMYLCLKQWELQNPKSQVIYSLTTLLLFMWFTKVFITLNVSRTIEIYIENLLETINKSSTKHNTKH